MIVTNTQKTYTKVRPTQRKRITHQRKSLTQDERWQLIINEVRKLNK